MFGLLGPNGAGKTTIVRILATIISHDAGEATVLGHDVASEAQVVRSLIGLAGQFAAVDENLTGKENLHMIGRLNHLPWPVVSERTAELLERFDLTDGREPSCQDVLGRHAPQARRRSGARRQAARAVLGRADDGSRPQSRSEVWAMIEQLVEGGTTVLLTTQYLEEADRLADHLVVIDHGKLIAEGTPASLKAGLGATVLDIGMADTDAALRAADALRSARGLNPTVEGTTVELNVDDGPGVVSEALRVLQDCDLAPATLALREPSLDDVFLALTGHRTDSDRCDVGRRHERERGGQVTATIPSGGPSSGPSTGPSSGSKLRTSPERSDRRVRSGSDGSFSTP